MNMVTDMHMDMKMIRNMNITLNMNMMFGTRMLECNA